MRKVHLSNCDIKGNVEKLWRKTENNKVSLVKVTKRASLAEKEHSKIDDT